MTEKIRVGIVGTGGMARAHAEMYGKIEGVELTSCLDVVPGRAAAFAEKHGVVKAAESLDELLDVVDVVSVVTPDRFHAEPTIAALNAGKHVLCEKPLTVTLAEAREVARAAQAASERGVVHMTNFSYRNAAAFWRAREVVASGVLGSLRHTQSFYLQSWLAADMWGPWTSEGLVWRLRASQSGGVLGDLGCHILDLTTGVAGEVQRIRCDLRTFPKICQGEEVTEWDGEPVDANDTAVVELEYANGAIGILHTSRWSVGHGNHLRLEVTGSEGALMIDLDQSYRTVNVCAGEGKRSMTWTPEEVPPIPNNHERFIASIRSESPEQPDAIRGAQIQAYLDACERSAASGRWESVEAWI